MEEAAAAEVVVVTPGEVLGKTTQVRAGRGAYVAPHNNLVYASLTGFRRTLSPPPNSPDQVTRVTALCVSVPSLFEKKLLDQSGKKEVDLVHASDIYDSGVEILDPKQNKLLLIITHADHSTPLQKLVLNRWKYRDLNAVKKSCPNLCKERFQSYLK